MLVRHRSSYVDGAWISDAEAERFSVINPASTKVIAEVELGTRHLADRAARAARAAQPGWAATSAPSRMAVLERVVDLMRERQDELTDVIVAEVGTARTPAFHQQVGEAIAAFADAARLLPEALEPEATGNALTVMEPVGVVAGITPWNFPLWQIALKVAPALAAGCAFVLKPAELTPLSAIALTEILEEAGVPRGVFNLVLGRGAEIGAALAEHPLIDMVSLTGSTRAGRAVAIAAAGTLKKVALELGGKGPLIVLPDADFEAAVRYGVTKCFTNNGQTCAALTRILVPRGRMDEAARIAGAAVEEYVIGDPSDPNVQLGPLVSEHHRDTVREYIRSGVRDGARLVIGGDAAPAGTGPGWYAQPTVFADVTEGMAIAREEIFGPVLSILEYVDEADAVRIANDSSYGLSAGVYGGDRSEMQRVARLLHAGCVFIGNATPNMQAPFGGVKQSGYGRERGLHGVRDYLVTKSLIGAIR